MQTGFSYGVRGSKCSSESCRERLSNHQKNTSTIRFSCGHLSHLGCIEEHAVEAFRRNTPLICLRSKCQSSMNFNKFISYCEKSKNTQDTLKNILLRILQENDENEIQSATSNQLSARAWLELGNILKSASKDCPEDQIELSSRGETVQIGKSLAYIKALEKALLIKSPQLVYCISKKLKDNDLLVSTRDRSMGISQVHGKNSRDNENYDYQWKIDLNHKIVLNGITRTQEEIVNWSKNINLPSPWKRTGHVLDASQLRTAISINQGDIKNKTANDWSKNENVMWTSTINLGKSCYEIMLNSLSNSNIDETRVRENIKNHFSHDKRALGGIDRVLVLKSNTETYNITGLTALSVVWQYAESKSEPTKSNLKEQLSVILKEIDTERVCSYGRFAQVLCVPLGIDGDISDAISIDLNFIKYELQTNASKIIEDELKPYQDSGHDIDETALQLEVARPIFVNWAKTVLEERGLCDSDAEKLITEVWPQDTTIY